LKSIEKRAKNSAKSARSNAWTAFEKSILEDHNEALKLINACIDEGHNVDKLAAIRDDLMKTLNPIRSDTIRAVKIVLRTLRGKASPATKELTEWLSTLNEANQDRFNSFLYSEMYGSALNITEIKPKYHDNSPIVDGREVLQACFDAMLARDPRIIAFGEDVGKIGDVNQGFAGLQEKYGELRVMDTGIRESTIVGQGIGCAMRGLRPIAEIQYLDYIYFAIQTLADDLATLLYRTKGGQKAPLIVRTRGHRLEGIWHSGSPMGMLLNSLRGIYVLVPRNMTQACGFYNTMLKSDDPALIIEPLNGYRLKERLPENIGEFTVPLGVSEVVMEGGDVTIVTYGSMVRIVMDAVNQLQDVGISCEVIDVQTLLPFDLKHIIVESLKNTNRIVFADEDVPGGASAFMMQKVIEDQKGYRYLDSQPVTITGKEHRPAYASDGDYFSKPNAEEVFDKVYALMSEFDPERFPEIY